jgi:uncharacterized protein (UPF0276 family)
MSPIPQTSRSPSHALPQRAGLGLKPQHGREVIETLPEIGFFEVHAENYMGAGGPPHRLLESVRNHYPLSLHGVALSIGGEDPLDRDHLWRLRQLIGRYEPASFSEHLAWSSHNTVYLNDLLPVPYTPQTLQRVCDHVDQVQDALGTRMLLENPSTYLEFEQTEMSEVDFLRDVACRTGCGLLLDVNNVFVSAINRAYDAVGYIDRFPVQFVAEIHLAGFAEDEDDEGRPLLIDAHGAPVDTIVWALYERILGRTGPLPTLIEWDNDVPAFAVLMEEARRADAVLERHSLTGLAAGRAARAA